MIPKSRLLLFCDTNFGVLPASPEDAPDYVECPTCGEDVLPGALCLECANGELRDAA